MSIRGFFSSIFSKKKPVKVHILSSEPVLASISGSEIYTPRRMESQVSKEELEQLYHTDPLTFQIVQKFVTEIVGQGFFLEDGEHIQETMDWCRRVDLPYIASEIVKDCFITGAGNAWVELGYADKDIVILRMINPKTGIDYIRDPVTKLVQYDEMFKPLGFRMGGILGYPTVEWTKDSIKIRDEVVWRRKGDDDGRDRVAHFKLVGLGEYELGVSPIAPTFKTAIIRLNLEDTVGNLGFRMSSIVASLGTPEEPESITDETIQEAVNTLQNVDKSQIWAFRSNVSISPFPVPELRNLNELLLYIADVQCAGAGIKLPLLLQPLRGYAGDIEVAEEEFLSLVRHYQNVLSHQIREFFFKRLFKARNWDPDSAPMIKFRIRQGRMALSASRRIATYARRGLISYDPYLEKFIRDLEGLPSKAVDKLIEIWEKENRLPIISRGEDSEG